MAAVVVAFDRDHEGGEVAAVADYLPKLLLGFDARRGDDLAIIAVYAHDVVQDVVTVRKKGLMKGIVADVVSRTEIYAFFTLSMIRQPMDLSG
jgi:hypothetical protein